MVHRVLPPLFMDAINTAGAVKWAVRRKIGGARRVEFLGAHCWMVFAQCALLAYNICIVTRRACASSAHSGCKAQRLKRTRAHARFARQHACLYTTHSDTHSHRTVSRARASYIQPTNKENIKF